MTRDYGAQPYGPATPIIRRFLVRLAALESAAHDAIVLAYHAASLTAGFVAADVQLGETIERSGRGDARDALFGPFVQLLREREPPPDSEQAPAPAGKDAEIVLDPIAESALAALMALLVSDLLPPHVLRTLYAPFSEHIPLESVIAA